ncbi:MAG TPA: hypothetical protein VLR29_00380 [Flavobacterium sp.]|nr:hypothetical protein [Flavobacterium sp.]
MSITLLGVMYQDVPLMRWFSIHPDCIGSLDRTNRRITYIAQFFLIGIYK